MERQVKRLIIHVTDSPDDRDVGFHEIDIWHSKRFTGVEYNGKRIFCGYHYIVRRDGTIESGRPESAIGAHVAGHNRDSLGIVWVGRKKIEKAQYESLIAICIQLLARYKLSSDDVYGHTELNRGKTCPNLDMNTFREDLENSING